MQITFTDTEIWDIQSSYQHYVAAQQALPITSQEETFYQETLQLFLYQASVIVLDPARLDALTFTFTLTPAQWRSLRTVVIKELAIYISIQAHMMTARYSGILAKLDALTLVAYVEEAEETGKPSLTFSVNEVSS